MKPAKRHPYHLLLSFALLSAGLAAAAVTQFESQPLGNRVQISGEYQLEQLGQWSCEGVAIIGTLTADREALLQGRIVPAGLNLAVKVPIRSLQVRIPVRESVMADWTWMEQHPAAIFTLRECAFLKPSPDGTLAAEFKGDLALAGATNRMAVPVVITPLENGGLKIAGQMKTNLGHFGIRPQRFYNYRKNDEAWPVPGPKPEVAVEFTWCLREKPKE